MHSKTLAAGTPAFAQTLNWAGLQKAPSLPLLLDPRSHGHTAWTNCFSALHPPLSVLVTHDVQVYSLAADHCLRPSTPPPLSPLPCSYQRVIHECGVCDRPINDGSERVFSRSYEAPKGKFRYECDQCTPPFNLCEQCYDRWAAMEGGLAHARCAGS